MQLNQYTLKDEIGKVNVPDTPEGTSRAAGKRRGKFGSKTGGVKG